MTVIERTACPRCPDEAPSRGRLAAGAILAAAGLLTAFGCAGPPRVGVDVRQMDGALAVEWSFTNTTGSPIWVAEAAEIRPNLFHYTLPLVYVVPPADLMLVSGDFAYNPSRHNFYFNGSRLGPLGTRFREVKPGETWRGRTVLPVPYDVITQRHFERLPASQEDPEFDELIPSCYVWLWNPLQSRGGIYDDPVQISRIESVQVAMEYWTEKPSWEGLETSPLQAASRRSMARSMIDGRRLEGRDEMAVVSGIALSRRVPVKLALKRPVRVVKWASRQRSPEPVWE